MSDTYGIHERFLPDRIFFPTHVQYTQTDTDSLLNLSLQLTNFTDVCTDSKRGNRSAYGPLIVFVSLVIQLIKGATVCRFVLSVESVKGVIGPYTVRKLHA